MASAPMDENPMYNYHGVLEKVWLGHLRRRNAIKLKIAKDFFGDFVRHHRTFQFSVIKIFDGTTHVMVDKEQYKMMKRELEGKTGVSLPDIDRPMDMSSPNNAVMSKRGFASQEQFHSYVSDLEKENVNVHQR
jgi:hypothetical protein